MNNQIYVDTYIMYGLNRRRAFLEPPTCEDCGHEGGLLFDSEKDLKDFSMFVLTEHYSTCCALFIVHKDGTYESYFKVSLDEEDEEGDSLCEIGRCKSEDSHMFAALDGEFRFEEYSILVEITSGVYEVKI